MLDFYGKICPYLSAATRFSGWCLPVIAAFAMFSAAQGAPVTFRFEAEVASVLSTNGGASLPFSTSPGDRLVTTFTFEPAAGGPQFPQSGTLRFDIAGHAVEVLEYMIEVRDESAPNAAPITGSIADPLNHPIVDQGPGNSDNIFLLCGSSQGLYCGTVVGHTELGVRPVVVFSTDANVLDSSDLTADLTIWNSFSFRELSLSFANPNSGGETYVGAYIGDVEQIPEFGTLSMAFSAIISSMFRRLRVL